MSFTSTTRTFSGTPVDAADIGDLNIKVTATNTKLLSVAQTFPLNITQTLSATNVAQTMSYFDNTYYNFVGIVISTPNPTVTAQLTLSDYRVGELTVATSGSVTSTYNVATGVWQANGDIADVNALLANLRFQPAANLCKNFTIGVEITDGYGQGLISTIKAISAIVTTCIESSAKDAAVLGTSSIPLIAGVVGGVAVFAGLGALALLIRKRHQERLKQKVWDFDCRLKPSKLHKDEHYRLIAAKKEDIQKVVEYYQHCPVPGMEIRSVKIIHNPNLEGGFVNRIATLQEREGKAAFAPHWLEESNEALRKAVMYKLDQMTFKYIDKEYNAVKVLPVWHGTRAEILDSIFTVGYADLSTLDAGFFGRGLYSAYEAKYASEIYSHGALLINWVSFYSAYPVVGDDMDQLFGKTHYQNYDAHFVPVKPVSDVSDETNFYPCTDIKEAKYHEIVVFEAAQCLPRYLVELQPTLLPPIPMANAAGRKQRAMQPTRKQGGLAFCETTSAEYEGANYQSATDKGSRVPAVEMGQLVSSISAELGQKMQMEMKLQPNLPQQVPMMDTAGRMLDAAGRNIDISQTVTQQGFFAASSGAASTDHRKPYRRINSAKSKVPLIKVVLVDSSEQRMQLEEDASSIERKAVIAPANTAGIVGTKQNFFAAPTKASLLGKEQKQAESEARTTDVAEDVAELNYAS